MNNPSQGQAQEKQENVAGAASVKPKFLRGADKQRNREVGHLLKNTSMHRPMAVRSVPHARGR
jgi:hypothetical protein